MIRSFSANTDTLIIVGIGLSNALVALSGGMIAQYQGFADIGMGIGLILVGLASVILGQAIFFGARHIIIATLAVIVGSIAYRIVIYGALKIGFDPNDMKLISAVLVVVALLIPQWSVFQTLKREVLRIFNSPVLVPTTTSATTAPPEQPAPTEEVK